MALFRRQYDFAFRNNRRLAKPCSNWMQQRVAVRSVHRCVEIRMQCDRIANLVERKVRRLCRSAHREVSQKSAEFSGRRKCPGNPGEWPKVGILEDVVAGHGGISWILR